MPFEVLLPNCIFSVALAAALVGTFLPLFGIFQQTGYSARAFFRWAFRRNGVRTRYLLLFTALLFLTAFLPVAFSFAGRAVAVSVALAVYLAFCALFCYAFRFALKTPTVFTRRMVRLLVATGVLTALLLFGAQTGLYFAAEAIGSNVAHLLLRTVPLALAPLFGPFVIVAADGVMRVYEVPRTRALLGRAKAALGKSDCVKIGITGSFGKTSVKEYARVLLGDGAFATPASYNTPAGIAKCVNGSGLDCKYFLAEMGARKAGDIAELCDLVRPEYGVITGICPQHVQTFGSVEAIAREKGELARRAKKVVAGRSAAEIAGENALVEGRDFFCDNIELSRTGISFDLTLGGERHTVHAPLLGRHAAEDVALAAALAYLLGVPLSDILARIPLLSPVPHRLEHSASGGVDILDDSYNSNIEGAKNAAETLQLFGGERYAVTPGLVELGGLEESINEELGGLLAKFRVILVGETLVLPVKRGFLAAGGAKENIRIVPTLRDAQSLLAAELREGDCVLFLNDLPDKYL